MAIEILSRSFFNPITGETLGYYKANAGDKIQCTFTIRETVSVKCDGYNFTYDYASFTITASTFNFRGEGFLAGDNIKCTKFLSDGSIDSSFSTTVTTVSTSQIKIGHTIPPIGVGEYFLIEQASTLPLRQELHLFVNHKQASSGIYDQFSHIDGEVTAFQGLNMPTITSVVTGTLTQFGNQSGQWEVTPNAITKGEGADTSRQYVVGFTVVQSGIYQDSLFTSSDCLNLAVGFRMFRVSGDLNTATTIFDDYASNTGRFNEGFNDEPNFLTTTQFLPPLFYNMPITGTFKISGAVATLKGIGASYIPTNAGYYQHKPISQTKLGMTIPTSGAVASTTYTGGNDADPLTPEYDLTINSFSIASGVITCNITFTPNFNGFFDTKALDRRFVIWAKVDNVNQIVFDGQLLFKAPADEPFTPTFFEVVDFRENDLTPVSNTITPLVVEDNASIRAKIPMVQGDLLSSINIRIISKNIVTGDYFVLQSDSFNLNSSPYLSGAYIGEQTINKSYNLASGSVKNEAKLQPTALAGTAYDFILNYPFLIRWEDWITKGGVPLDFYGSETEKWINYQTSDWKLFAEISKTFPDFHQEIAEEQLLITDYDSDSNVTVHDIVLKRLDGTILTSVIDEQLTITVNTTATGAITQEEIELTIEPKQSAPRWQLSTAYANANPNNPITLVSSVTTGSSNVSIFNLDTSKINISNGVSITAEIKGLAIAEPIANRIKETFNYVKLPSGATESEYDYGCCVQELKLASLTSSKPDHNDVAGVYVFIGSDVDIIFSKLYKDGIELESELMDSLPEDSFSRFKIYSCKEWLSNYGAGCFEVRISGVAGGISFEYIYGSYRLQPYNAITSRNQFRLRCFNDKYSSDEKVNFANSNYYDDIRLGGSFGKMQPKTVVENLIYHDRVTRSIINENLPEYSLESNKISPLLITKLVKMILQATTIEASDYNRYAPDFTRNLQVILPKEGQGLLLDYIGGTQDRIVSCAFRKKLLNERTFTK